MKKLSKLVLHKAKVMSAPQMKHIFGGYDEYGGNEYDDYNPPARVGYRCACDNNGEVSLGIPWSWTTCVMFPSTLQISLSVCRTGGTCTKDSSVSC